jgi:hypothetical protein
MQKSECSCRIIVCHSLHWYCQCTNGNGGLVSLVVYPRLRNYSSPFPNSITQMLLHGVHYVQDKYYSWLVSNWVLLSIRTSIHTCLDTHDRSYTSLHTALHGSIPSSSFLSNNDLCIRSCAQEKSRYVLTRWHVLSLSMHILQRFLAVVVIVVGVEFGSVLIGEWEGRVDSDVGATRVSVVADVMRRRIGWIGKCIMLVLDPVEDLE